MNSLHSFAFGLATHNSSAELIEAFYPMPCLNPSAALSSLLASTFALAAQSNNTYTVQRDTAARLAAELETLGESGLATQLSAMSASEQTVIACLVSVDAPPQSIPEAFLKLHLLSHRQVLPHQLNLNGMFGILKNLAWTNLGPIDLDDLPALQLAARLEGKFINVETVDKFPKMTNYIVPRGVRIADAARVRLGAHLGEGTTVMHEGFVNFNAGTKGAAMIEGRISAGVIVDENTDLGGGCSTMGTLSGGGTEIISVGKNCLIGANAGIGFPLADGCIVEAGLYVTAGTKVQLLDATGSVSKTAKALELAPLTDMLFRRNSISGAVECVPLKTSMSLNEELHSNN
ncbi:MAG: 2,3,4,5-tetrahydropyridine-2-carboxylate N-succinyltransferase [Pseudohongiellaceae bacterium]|jgi:2,3,4,5-tetrahydropyridine-2-carboxylate N-succinyltransferase